MICYSSASVGLQLIVRYSYVAARYGAHMVQLNSKLTLVCVSLASTRKVSNITREIIASARTSLTNQLLSTLIYRLNAREITRACTNCGMPLESAIVNRELPLINLHDRCTCAMPTFKPTQIGLLL